MVHTTIITTPLLRHAAPTRPRTRHRALHCVATATADDLLVPAATDRLPPPPSQRPRFDDDETQAKQQRPSSIQTLTEGHQPYRSRTAPRANRRAPQLPAAVSPDDVPQLITESVGHVSAFISALDAANLAAGSVLNDLRAGMLGNDRPPANMRRSQLIHAAYVAGHALKHAPPEDALPATVCRNAQTAVVCLLAIGGNAPHAPSYPQLRKLLASLQMATGRLEGVHAALLSYTVLRTLAAESDLVPLAKALDVWQGVGIITHADQERFAQLLAPRVMDAHHRAAAGLSPAFASDVCEAAAQCFAVWARVRYLPDKVDMQLFMELLTTAIPYASAWQVAMILRNSSHMGVRLTGEQVVKWTAVVNDVLPRASTADLHKLLCAYGFLRRCPPELNLEAILTALSAALPTMAPAMLVSIFDALGNMGLPSVPASFDQEAFGEAVNASVERMRDQEMGMLLRGLLKANCVPLTLDFDLLGSCATTLVANGMQHKDLLSVLLFFQQLQSPPATLNVYKLAAGVMACLPDMTNSDLMRALRALGALKVASRQSFVEGGLNLDAFGADLTARIGTMEPREVVQLAPLVGRLRLGHMPTFDSDLYQQRLAMHLDSMDVSSLGGVMLGLGSMGIDALHNKGLQARMLEGVNQLRYKELSMLVSSLAKTATAITEDQLLALGNAFNGQMRHFSARQMSGSIWSFARLGGLPINFDLHSAERTMQPALATMRSNEVCSVLSSLANMYGNTVQRQQLQQRRAEHNSNAEHDSNEEEDAEDDHLRDQGVDQPGAAVHKAAPLYTPLVQPSVDFLQTAVNALSSRDDLPLYLSSLLWACCDLRILPSKTAACAMAAAVPAMVASDAQHMSSILLHLAKLRIPMDENAINLVLQGCLSHARTTHDVSLLCFAAAMLLADQPGKLPALQPTLQAVADAASGTVDKMSPDDARQLLTLHHTVAMAAETQNDPGQCCLVTDAVLQRCRTLQPQRSNTPVRLQTALTDMAARVPGVESVEMGHTQLDGIVRMAAVCHMESGEVVALHTSWVRPAYRNTSQLDGPAQLRMALLQWKGLRVAQLHGRAWMRLEDDEARLAALTKAVHGRRQPANAATS